MPDFKVGDRVVAIPSHKEGSAVRAGEFGTVLAFQNEGALIRVAFDEINSERHSLSGECPNGHGWVCEVVGFDFIEPQNKNQVKARKEW